MSLCDLFKTKSINLDLLNLAKIAYGGELYFGLKEYRLKEVLLPGSKIEKMPDIVLSKKYGDSFYSYKNVDSGFCACIFEHIKTGNIIIAYRGTERPLFGENNNDYITWGKDIRTDINLILGNDDEQFRDAFEFYRAVKDQNQGKDITIIGHSLGGGLCQIVSAREYSETYKTNKPVKLKTYTYNAPGCKQLLKTFKCNEDLDYSFITNYTVMNDWCGMFGENIGETYLVSPIQLKKVENLTPAEVLNNVLLTTHEGIFDYSKTANGRIVKKPKDFNQQEGLSLWYFDTNNPIKDVDTMPEFMAMVMPKLNIPTFEIDGKSIKEVAEKFIDDNNITLPQVEIPKFDAISEQIKDAADKFIDEQKAKLNQIEFPEPTLPEPIKKWAETISEKHAENTEKFMDNINNNIIMALSKLMEATVSEVSVESLKRAQYIIQKKLNFPYKLKYIENITKYLSLNK